MTDMANLSVDSADVSENAEVNSRVLLVDDQPIVAEAFKRMLIDVDDIDIQYCADPEQAIEAARSYKPTVILQDLVMPNIDGLTLLELFRTNSVTMSIPIIVMSTKEDPKIKSAAFAKGASDYLVKFPDQIELLARVRAHSRSYWAQRELHATQMELKRKNAELEALSCRDALTGILNRRGFDEYLRKEWLRAIRKKTELGLALIDIDFFKHFNDNYGHQGGDECLRHVARALGEKLHRPSDVVARYGGEEFVVVLPDTNLLGSAMIAESLRSAVEALHYPHEFSAAANCVTVSVGVAVMAPKPNESQDVLIKHADEALYSAKDDGRNRYACYAAAKPVDEVTSD